MYFMVCTLNNQSDLINYTRHYEVIGIGAKSIVALRLGESERMMIGRTSITIMYHDVKIQCHC